MNNEDLYDGITDIRDDLIQEAKTPKRTRRLWISAVAAALAAAVLIGVAPRFGGGSNVGSGGSSGGSGGDTQALSAHAVAQAAYPEMPPYPKEEDYINQRTGVFDDEGYFAVYEPWYHAWRDRWDSLPEDYAAGMEGFFTGSIRQFLSGAEGQNRVYSPVNVCMALSMLAELTDGDSRRQILDLLGQDSLEDLRVQAASMWKANYCDDGVSASILANSLWLNQNVSFVPSTLETLAKSCYASSYQGEMGSEDFNQALRDWISQQTAGLLDEQAGGLSLDPETVLALVSTIYFRGKWQAEFSESNTAPQVFHAPDGDVTCDFLHQSDGNLYYWGEQFSAVSKSLDGSNGYMWFFLPDEGVTPEALLEDPQFMEFLLLDNKWENWTDQTFLIVNLSLPKFDVSSELDLREGLQALGITDVFDPARSDFTPMTESEDNLYVSQAQHAVRVSVDEEGVAAAAYTVMAMSGGGMPPADEVDFTLDRPFLFAITGVDGLPLFAGIVNHPQ